MTSTDLIKRNGNGLPAPAEINQQLSDLRERGDTDTLLEVSRQAAVYQEYEKRQDAKERANTYGRIKVTAEAHIGLLDLEMYPLPKHGEILVAGEPLERRLRNEFRVLGAASRLGWLERSIAALEHGEEIITTYALVREFRALGVNWLDAKPLQARYRELKRTAQWNPKAVQAKSGLSETTVRRYLINGKAGRMPHFVALRLADAMDVDVSTLRPTYKRGSGRRTGRQLPRKRKLMGGRLDEAYVLVRKTLQELDRAAGDQGRWGTGEAFDHLYKAEEIIGKAMKRAT